MLKEQAIFPVVSTGFDKFSRHLVVPALILLALVVTEMAEASPRIFVGASYGESQPDESGFSEDKSYSLGVGARWPWINVGMRMHSLGEYVREGRDARIDVKGISLDFSPRWAINDAFSLELHTGLLDWTATAHLFGKEVGTDEGTDYYLGAGLRIDGSERYSLILSYDQFLDVSGSDIQSLTLSLERQF